MSKFLIYTYIHTYIYIHVLPSGNRLDSLKNSPYGYADSTLKPSDRKLNSLSSEGAEAERADPHRSFVKRAFKHFVGFGELGFKGTGFVSWIGFREN